jgi:nucleotide-binding universal stress UspA family protein/GNAT superfamily N-acetyltransferase
MFATVLIPVDFSEYSLAILNRIDQIPGIAEIVLLHVLDAPRASTQYWISGRIFESPLDTARKELEARRKDLEERGFRVRTRLEFIEHGDVPQAIIAVADEIDASLIVMGARGKGIIGGLILGSVSSGVLRRSMHNVLIMHPPRNGNREEAPPLFSRVLAPVDFSRPTEEMMVFLRGIENLDGIILLHVIGSAESRSELAFFTNTAKRRLERMAAEAEKGGRSAAVLVRAGNPVDEICEVADTEDVSLITMPRCGKADYVRNVQLGGTTAGVMRRARRPVFVLSPRITLEVKARELDIDEFPLAEEVWQHYRQQAADPATDHIFGVFVESILAGVARCRRHADGLEVDGVFVLSEFRKRGYARMAMQALLDAFGDETLYMHATLELIPFYGTFGFVSIPEIDLPPTIRERFRFALGEMEGMNVQPMRRVPEKE